jgi:hypothetical protein
LAELFFCFVFVKVEMNNHQSNGKKKTASRFPQKITTEDKDKDKDKEVEEEKSMLTRRDQRRPFRRAGDQHSCLCF